MTIIHHPDVRRMLMLQKAYAEGHAGAGALHGHAAGRRADRRRTTASVDPAAAARNDLLLPVVKGVGSERAYEMLALSLQTLGGSGFLQDYPIEQYIRDSKIDSLYEGTTAIQSLDFFFRKIGPRPGGATATALLAEIAAFAAADRRRDGRLKTERAAIAEGVANVEAVLNAMTGFRSARWSSRRRSTRSASSSVRLLLAFGDLIVAWLLGRQAEVAAARARQRATRCPTESDRDFYTGKLAVARFFATTVLPRLESDRKIIEQTTTTSWKSPRARSSPSGLAVSLEALLLKLSQQIVGGLAGLAAGVRPGRAARRRRSGGGPGRRGRPCTGNPAVDGRPRPRAADGRGRERTTQAAMMPPTRPPRWPIQLTPGVPGMAT